ncbi:MAG: thioesterase family protein [Myxococcota bacterium]
MNEDSLTSILDPLNEGETTVVPATWSQGRAVYGGMVAALAFRRARRVLGSDVRPARGAHIWFTGPLAPGPVEVKAEIVRAGKSAVSVETRLTQEGQERANVRVSFGGDRTSSIKVSAPSPASLPEVDGFEPMPFMEGAMPDFLRYFDLRWTEGDYPYSGSDRTHIGGWSRCRLPGATGLEALALHVDVWPSPAVPMLSTFAPASSMTWTLDILGDVDHLESTEWSRYTASLEACGNGYGYMTAWNWGSDGRPLARSSQLIAVYG